ncbi:hypothetical protein ACFUYE_01635 [Micromonospora humida]|uniref:hypothetical protein n=1 Tax=Micromonospora humida TaxID=2809018 RepID=UPI003671112C
MSGGRPKRRRGSSGPDRKRQAQGGRPVAGQDNPGGDQPVPRLRRVLGSLHRAWWFVLGTALAALLGAVTSIYATRWVDDLDPQVVAVHVVANPATVDTWGTAEFAMVLPKDARPSDDPPVGCATLIDWARALGAVDHQVSRVRVVVQGAGDQGVLIDNLRARVIRRSQTPEPSGVQLRCGGQQGAAEPRDVEMDLDAPQPAARYRTLIEGRRPLFGFTLAKGETEVFDLTAFTTGTVEWTLELDLVAAGKRKRVEVTNRGRSFVTTAAPGPRTYQVPPGGDHWIECVQTPRLACPDSAPPAHFRYDA